MRADVTLILLPDVLLKAITDAAGTWYWGKWASSANSLIGVFSKRPLKSSSNRWDSLDVHGLLSSPTADPASFSNICWLSRDITWSQDRFYVKSSAGVWLREQWREVYDDFRNVQNNFRHFSGFAFRRSSSSLLPMNRFRCRAIKASC